MATELAFPQSAARSTPRLRYPILVAGLLAGVLDLAAGLTQSALRGGNPVRFLQTIAMGWRTPGLGRRWPLNGTATGILIHVFCVGMPIAWASRRV